MSRVYGEPVDVWTQEGRPVRFVWRGRLYTVLKVLEHWVTTREWWKKQTGAEPEEASEREFWRVEATAGKEMPVGVYELRYDAATDRWLLARIWD